MNAKRKKYDLTEYQIGWSAQVTAQLVLTYQVEKTSSLKSERFRNFIQGVLYPRLKFHPWPFIGTFCQLDK